MAISEKELTLKAGGEAPAEAPAAEAPSRVTVATASSLGLTMESARELPAGVDRGRKAYQDRLVARVNEYLARKEAEDDGAPREIGEPTVGTYVGIDVVSFSPRQQITLPPYSPSRIIAGGEDAVITAVVFINPAVDVAQGFAIPATVQLGNRPIRIRLEQVNLTEVTNGPDLTVSGVLPSPAPTLLFVDFPFTAADPGVNPALFEANVTVDIGDLAQPWAAFATHHVSRDADFGFLDIPPQGPDQLLHNIPLRYLVYSK